MHRFVIIIIIIIIIIISLNGQLHKYVVIKF